MSDHTQDLASYLAWLEETGRLTHEEKEMVLNLVAKFAADELVLNQQGC